MRSIISLLLIIPAMAFNAVAQDTKKDKKMDKSDRTTSQCKAGCHDVSSCRKETKNVITFSGTPLTLLGEPAVVGQVAPEFSAVNAKNQVVKLSDFKGKVVVITVFPSIDTPVCANQTRTFNQKATEIGPDVVVLTLSKDLPFALGRFCAAEGIEKIFPLSDFRESEFGLKYGFLIKENYLLARGTIIVDRDGKIAYVEYVNDTVKEPNYEAVIDKLKTL